MTELDAIDRAIVNRLQDGFPICEHPYAAVADELGMGEQELLDRLGQSVAGAGAHSLWPDVPR